MVTKPTRCGKAWLLALGPLFMCFSAHANDPTPMPMMAEPVEKVMAPEVDSKTFRSLYQMKKQPNIVIFINDKLGVSEQEWQSNVRFTMQEQAEETSNVGENKTSHKQRSWMMETRKNTELDESVKGVIPSYYSSLLKDGVKLVNQRVFAELQGDSNVISTKLKSAAQLLVEIELTDYYPRQLLGQIMVYSFDNSQLLASEIIDVDLDEVGEKRYMATSKGYQKQTVKGDCKSRSECDPLKASDIDKAFGQALAEQTRAALYQALNRM